MKRFTRVLVLIVWLAATGCSTQNKMAGLWVFSVKDANPPGIETRIDLRDDGTGTFTNSFYGEESSRDITWTAENDKLCITAAEQEPDCTAYTLNGDELTLDIPGEGPLVFSRAAGD